jgi:phospholipase C
MDLRLARFFHFLVACLFSQSSIAIDCSKLAGSLPTPHVEAGTALDLNPIEHTIVIMQENHSFDHYFGRLTQKKFYGNLVDGLTPEMSNKDSSGRIIYSHHEAALCTKNPLHNWNAMHSDWDNGRNDLFAANSGELAMGYYDDRDLSFYYSLANQFAISDRYFSSTMTQTYPNRFFLLTGTAFGQVKNQIPLKNKIGYTQKTIFELLNDYGISWKYYRNGIGYLYLFSDFYYRNRKNVAPVAQFKADLRAGHLAQVVFIDSDWEGQDEHPGRSIQVGQYFVAEVIKDLVQSSFWATSVAFFEYDEGGGFFDHVSPPAACRPDHVRPILSSDSIPGDYDRYGFRVPFIAISPFAKRHYVSHITHDHTSILKFIETKYNLPALTARDANADNLSDVFDFAHPNYQIELPELSVPTPMRCR